MFHNFGFFRLAEATVDEQTNVSTTSLRNEEGKDFYTEVSRRLADWDSNGNFIRADHPFYMSVNEDFTVRVISNDPSRAIPTNAYFVATDVEGIEPGWTVDIEAGSFSPPPPPPPAPHVIDKARFFDDFTDEEFELWDEKFPTASARQRTLWNNGTLFASDLPNWNHIQALMVHVFGEAEGKAKAPDHPTS